MKRIHSASLLFALVTACGSTTQTAPATTPTANSMAQSNQPMQAPDAAPGAPDPLPTGRLPDSTRPTHYALALDVDPTHERYQGTIAIDVSIAAPTRGVVMHGRGLTIRRAAVTPAGGGAAIVATTSFREAAGGRGGEPEELVLHFDRDIPAGNARIEISFEREFERGLRGLYRVHSGNDWYAYTQMEPNDARRAFPCFDEPGYKVPWDVSVTIPHDTTAIANMPEAARTPSGDHTVVRFATTPPTPSYLIALGVGPFDVVQGANTPVPVRAIATRGQGALTRTMLDTVEAHIQILADYFDRPYPYPKLDLVAVPEFSAGAMENPGMITFREELMLIDPAHAPTAARRAMASVLAHELSHQWFGDLVTMAWWNDLWLNEGFATWAQSRVVDQWQPTFGARVEELRSRGWAMETDSLPAARAVRQPVTNTSEALEAFDAITYTKGGAVLRMLEQWLGENDFRAGIRRYIHAHEWGNATAQDLFTALGEVSHRDVAAVAATFLDQPGVPVVQADVSCPTGGAPTLTLSQTLYSVPRTSQSASAEHPIARTWLIPVCVDFEADHAPKHACVLLSTETACAPLEGATRCPRWLHPNSDEAGYYHYAVTPIVRAVAARNVMPTLGVRERAGFVDDSWAMVRSGQLGVDDFMRSLDAFRTERDRDVVDVILRGVDEVFDGLADDSARAATGTWIGNFVRPLGHELGWVPRAGEPDERRLLRRSVLMTLGAIADDHATLTEAEHLAQQYLHDAHSVDADIASIAVPLASRHAGADRLDAIIAAIPHAATPADRVLLNSALGSFNDPALLRRGLDLTLTDAIRVQDFGRVMFTAFNDPVRRPVVTAWIQAHYDAIRAKLPSDFMSHFAGMVSGACTQDEITAHEAFWRPRVGDIEGGDRALREGTERAEQCVAQRLREHDHLAAFLGGGAGRHAPAAATHGAR